MVSIEISRWFSPFHGGLVHFTLHRMVFMEITFESNGFYIFWWCCLGGNWKDWWLL